MDAKDSPLTALALPPSPTPLVGRTAELTMLRELLTQGAARLLTLTGPPGVGKTRLALEVARAVEARFSGGVWFVDLSPLSNGALVLPTIAQAVGLTLDGSLTPVAFAAWLDEPSLLVLDNFEQVLPAAADVTALLAACPALTLLVTSRTPLNVRWEQTLPVLPLPLPDLEQLPPLPKLATLPSVALFLKRAQTRCAPFALSSDNASTIATLCVALDGLPLALELAAAQVARLPLTALLDMLRQHLPLPPWGVYDLPQRQQTLPAAVAWSVDLLSDEAQTLFRRLAVFVDGWTIEAATIVAGEGVDPALVTTALATLVDANLVVPAVSEPPRFTMLHTVRSYAAMQLAGRGERTDAEQRHTAYCLHVAEQARQAALTPERLVGLALLQRLEMEREDVHAAFERSLDHIDALEIALQFVAALAPVWMLRGELAAGRVWLERATQHALQAPPTPTLLVALSWAATFAFQQGDLHAAQVYREQCLILSEQLHDQPRRAAALLGLALLHDVRGQYQDAIALNEQALGVYDALGDVSGRAWTLTNMGHVVQQQGEPNHAVQLLTESLGLFSSIGELRGQAWAHIGLGQNAWTQENISLAAQQYDASLALFTTLGDVRGVAWATTNAGRVKYIQGDSEGALTLHEQSLQAYRTAGDTRGTARTLLHLGEALIAARRGAEAAASLAEAQTLFTHIGDQPHAARVQALQASLGMPPADDAVAPTLTLREQEVLRLVAEGLSNRAIAERLVITPGTVNVHLVTIYRKLQVSSRTAALHAARLHRLL